jgi:hypothetical protein
MLNGLIWVIVIFVLQAVISGLAKRAQQNAQQKPQQMQGGAQPTPGDLSNPAQSVRKSNAPKKVKPPKAADASTVVVKRPTSIVTGKRSAALGSTSAAKVQRSASEATGKPVSTSPSVRPPTTPARPAPAAVNPPKVTPPRVIARAEAPEEADAMASRAKVAASIARIRSIESSVSSSHVTGLGKNLGKPITAATQPAVSGAATRRDALTPAAIAQSLRNPQRIREAIIVSEVLGPPRGAR